MTTPAPVFDPAGRPVLVTGAAGFVGSHLCDSLLAAGAQVIALDNHATGDPAHLAHHAEHPRLVRLEADVTEPLPPEAREAGWIFNLACPASPAHYQRKPVATVLASTLGAWRLLELATATGARLLQVSTSEVYGDPQVHPQTEDYWGHVNPIGPRACYDEGKRAAEAMCYAYAAERGTEVRVARLFNCYGPRLTPGDGRVVSNFIVQALQGRPLTVYGRGTQTRSFCYVSDTVRGLLALMASDCMDPVNLGNPNEHTVLGLASRIRALVGREDVPLEYRPLPVDDPVRRRPDIARARYALGWKPEVTLDEGLRLTIAHFRERLGLPEATAASATAAAAD